MTPGIIRDPEGAKTAVLSFKYGARSIMAIQRQTFHIVCFSDMISGRLRVDPEAAAGGSQDPRKQGRKIILIFKSLVYTEASLDPERCTPKADNIARIN